MNEIKTYTLANTTEELDLDALFLNPTPVNDGMTFDSMLLTHEENKKIASKKVAKKMAELKIKMYRKEIERIEAKMDTYKKTSKVVTYRDHEGFFTTGNVYELNMIKANREIKCVQHLINELL